jgi:hypothetical protein
MNPLKALFSSAIALVAILMLSLFTSCSGNESQLSVDTEAPLIETTAHTAATTQPTIEKLPAETLAVKEETKVSTSGISLLKATTCTAIEGHLPAGAFSESDSYRVSQEIGRVYLHTQIKMPEGQSGTLQHVWKRDGKVVSTVDLTVKGPTFRTWSYKTITQKMTGNWTVDVQTAAGEVLETVKFEVE